jgi:hypothetical protein
LPFRFPEIQCLIYSLWVAPLDSRNSFPQQTKLALAQQQANARMIDRLLQGYLDPEKLN